MAMRVVTSIGADFLKALDTCLDSGLITVKEWEHAVVEVYLDNQVNSGNLRCDNQWSRGCLPAKWSYKDHYCTVEHYFNGYLCESCAEDEMVNGRGEPKLLTPVNGGVYVPDLHRVVAANWNMYCAMARTRKGIRGF